MWITILIESSSIYLMNWNATKPIFEIYLNLCRWIIQRKEILTSVSWHKKTNVKKCFVVGFVVSRSFFFLCVDPIFNRFLLIVWLKCLTDQFFTTVQSCNGQCLIERMSSKTSVRLTMNQFDRSADNHANLELSMNVKLNKIIIRYCSICDAK